MLGGIAPEFRSFCTLRGLTESKEDIVREYHRGSAFGLALWMMANIGTAAAADAGQDETVLPAIGSVSWVADCAMEGSGFSLRFHADSSGTDDDDMRVFLESPGKAPIALPLPPAWYAARGTTSNARSLCRNITALTVDGRILLWLSVNDRPDWDQLALVLMDPRSGQVLDQRWGVGSIKDGACGGRVLAIRERDGVHDVRLVREWLQDTDDDGPGNSIEDWMSVRVAGGRIIAEWKNPR